MSDLLLLREINSFWGGAGGLFTSPLRGDQMSPAGTSLLGTTASLSRLKRTENNGRRWIQSDVIKSRKMSRYSPVLKPFHAASCLSVSPSKKSWQNWPEYSLWCLPQIHIKDTGNQETESGISDSTWSGKHCPDILLFHPTTIDYRDNWKTWQPLELHFNAATVKNRRAGRRGLFSDRRHHSSSREKDRSCASAMQCQMREWYRDLRWVLRASTKVEQQQQRQWQWQQQRTSYTQNTGTQPTVRLEHDCATIFRVSG